MVANVSCLVSPREKKLLDCNSWAAMAIGKINMSMSKPAKTAVAADPLKQFLLYLSGKHSTLVFPLTS